MLEGLRSKKYLIGKIDTLKNKIAHLEEWRNNDWHWLTISTLQSRVDRLSEIISIRDQTIQNKNQRIAELQQMVIQLQNQRINQ